VLSITEGVFEGDLESLLDSTLETREKTDDDDILESAGSGSSEDEASKLKSLQVTIPSSSKLTFSS
jgi:hypothetical protein